MVFKGAKVNNNYQSLDKKLKKVVNSNFIPGELIFDEEL